MVLNAFLDELEQRGEDPKSYNLFAFRQGEALTERPAWERMQVNHFSRDVADAWVDQGHLRRIDLEAIARVDPTILTRPKALHGDDPRPLLIETTRPGTAVERALYPSRGARFYVQESPLDPPAWLLATIGKAGHATSPWLVYSLLNLAVLALMLALTHRLRTRPKLGASLRWTLAVAGLLAFIYIGNGFYEFRSSTSESFTAYFGRVRFTALIMMVLTLWIMAKKLEKWLNKIALVVLTLPVIWLSTKLAFLALPPHDYVTYPWLWSLITLFSTAAIAPDLLAWGERRLESKVGPLTAAG